MTRRPIDFLSRPKPPRVGWALLALGSAALASALWVDQHWASEREAAAIDDLRALEARRARLAPPRVVEPDQAERRWQQARPELRRPWLPALRAIESATLNPVFLLSLTIEPSAGVIKLDAEAPSFDHALAYVQVLDQGGALRPALLVSHEQVPNAGGREVVKFSAITRWVAP